MIRWQDAEGARCFRESFIPSHARDEKNGDEFNLQQYETLLQLISTVEPGKMRRVLGIRVKAIGQDGRLHADESTMAAIGSFQSDLGIQIFVFMAAGIRLTFLVSSNLTKPLQEITHVLRKVQHGIFETRVRVTSNDEIEYTGDVINAMAEGLVERDQLKQSLTLAKEIQLKLLPKDTWKLDGFDMAGKSEHCDETGGDYFDSIPAVGGEDPKFGLVTGDVSGHGISSSLLMAAV